MSIKNIFILTFSIMFLIYGILGIVISNKYKPRDTLFYITSVQSSINLLLVFHTPNFFLNQKNYTINLYDFRCNIVNILLIIYNVFGYSLFLVDISFNIWFIYNFDKWDIMGYFKPLIIFSSIKTFIYMILFIIVLKKIKNKQRNSILDLEHTDVVKETI